MTGTPRCRVGLGLGVGRLVDGPEDLGEVVDALEGSGLDSLWMSEVYGSWAFDPLAALAFAAARSRRIKLGTSVLVAPGRSPAQLAKQMATVDLLSGGRFFPILGLGSPDPDSLAALGVPRNDRGPLTDELVPLLRRIWSEDCVDHDGYHFQLREYRPQLQPARADLPVWLGGASDGELERAGRLADGWLASFAAAEEVARAIPIVDGAARAAGRAIEPDHYGVLLMYSLHTGDEDLRRFVRWRRPDRPVGEILPEGPEALVALLEDHRAAGATKFILVPATRPRSWDDHLAELSGVVHAVDPAACLLAT